jgi:UDP-glucose 4-epimerase
MSVLILGGAGFVGLNIAQTLLAAGRDVTLFDRAPVPEEAARLFAGEPGRFNAIAGDVTDPAALHAAIRPGLDALILGAAVTADAARDARDPATILGVNLMSQIPALEAARDAGVRRVINLSSAAAYGRAGERETELTETTPTDPIGLYAITKATSERVAARLGELWGLDVVSVRLSAVFGPWERNTGVRDTLSPQLQLATLAQAGQPALLDRPGRRDWVYAVDVAEAVLRLIKAKTLTQRLFNISSPEAWAALDWGQRLTALHPGFVCRLAEPGEAATVSLHGPVDRAPLATGRLFAELGWRARFGLDNSAEHFMQWWQRHAPNPTGDM